MYYLNELHEAVESLNLKSKTIDRLETYITDEKVQQRFELENHEGISFIYSKCFVEKIVKSEKMDLFYRFAFHFGGQRQFSYWHL